MRIKYRLTCDFVDNEETAKLKCERINAGYSRYMRMTNPAHYTLWTSKDSAIKRFVVWYHY